MLNKKRNILIRRKNLFSIFIVPYYPFFYIRIPRINESNYIVI